MTKKYIAGWNQPGYLPETEPEEFDSFADAREYIAGEIDDQVEVVDDIGEEMDDFAQEVRDIPGDQDSFSLLGPDGYAYWVMCEP